MRKRPGPGACAACAVPSCSASIGPTYMVACRLRLTLAGQTVQNTSGTDTLSVADTSPGIR
ncbi:MAG TPA: hypothetical protein VGY66_16990 [Gemmataceae bacterium]|nr:hypothetical protein [Gemmataceae bacterium]